MKIKLTIYLVFCLGTLVSWSQSTISGTVSDEAGDPLPGVNITVKGKNTGASSDYDGNYNITAKQGEVLEYSFLGFVSQSVTIGNQTTINISLKEDLAKLDEVVVIGYGTAKKSDLTGSVKSITSDKFVEGNQNSVQGLIRGKVAGARVTSSSGAEPGAAATIQIRGANSISGNNNPLYVVDGVPVPDSFSLGTDMNPNDIASIDILKDASATAIYGSRAANGLVMITTKRAKEEKTRVTFSAASGIQVLVKPIEYASGSVMATIDNQIQEELGNEPIYSEEQIAEIGDGTDWIDEGTRTGMFTDYAVGLYSRGESSTFNVNMGYYKNEGVIKNSEFNRLTLSTNYSKDFNDKFFMDGSIRISHSMTNTFSFSEGNGRENVMNRLLNTSPLFPAYNDDGSYGVPLDNVATFDENPLPAILESTNDLRRTSVYSTVGLGYKFNKNLDVKVNSAFLLQDSFSGTYLPRIVPAGGLVGGYAEVSHKDVRDVLLEAFLNYNLDIKKNNTKFLLGASMQNNFNDQYRTIAKGFNSDAYLYHNLGAANIIDPLNSNYVTTKRQSAFFRMNNNYDSRYLLTATVRLDASSRFGANNKTGVFPSVAFGWNASNEDFLKDSNVISRLKIRGSYGLTGNDRIPAGRSNALSETTWSTYAWGGESGSVGFSPLNIPNPDLKWETTKQFNIGFELGLIKNRVNIEFDYYDKTTDDLLFERDISRYLGKETFLQNIGSVKNTGLEFNIDARVIRTNKFRWNLNYNVAYNENEVLELPEGAESLALDDNIGVGGSNYPGYHKLQVGKPISSFYGFEVDRILQAGESSAMQPDLIPGEYTFKDQNGDGKINDEDRVSLGSGLPKVTMGLTNTFRYNNFSLDMTFTGAFDYVLFNVNKAKNESRWWKSAENRWTPINTDTDIPKQNGWANSSVSNDRFINKASFVRFQNITLSYKLPNSVIGLNNFRISISGENLHVFTDYDGFDPELSSRNNPTKAGLDWNIYPQNRVFSLKINAEF
ncbi:SusC/RagA family TonB-linked outer membrane protein [Algibacter mikhailovii]|uniref:SusC/RagA family TonB-linked outer membrane protein n=1 Tax=Algibacter mikhailovii TaxID=425498 RepID=A0A918VEH7_9FLAO|nr:TonB-dependent receptor [Algibacter mikhailovii]GGZ92091.1 SusC/RagA family TonB-linked outer membrane protein [Algibacter mikhailovii]